MNKKTGVILKSLRPCALNILSSCFFTKCKCRNLFI